jgi:hypothetical protein
MAVAEAATGEAEAAMVVAATVVKVTAVGVDGEATAAGVGDGPMATGAMAATTCPTMTTTMNRSRWLVAEVAGATEAAATVAVTAVMQVAVVAAVAVAVVAAGAAAAGAAGAGVAGAAGLTTAGAAGVAAGVAGVAGRTMTGRPTPDRPLRTCSLTGSRLGSSSTAIGGGSTPCSAPSSEQLRRAAVPRQGRRSIRRRSPKTTKRNLSQTFPDHAA